MFKKLHNWFRKASLIYEGECKQRDGGQYQHHCEKSTFWNFKKYIFEFEQIHLQVEQIPLIRLRANKGGGGQYQHHCARKYILKFKLSIFEHYEVEGQQRWWWPISTTLCRKVQPRGDAHWRKVNCGEKSTLEEGGRRGRQRKSYLFVLLPLHCCWYTISASSSFPQ